MAAPRRVPASRSFLPLIERAAQLGAAACLIALPLLSLLPSNVIERTGAGKDFEHFIAYGGTGLLLTLGIGPRWARIVASALLVLLAGGLEIAQSFTVTRSAELAQFFAGTLGAAAGLVTGSLIRRLLEGRLFAKRNVPAE